MHVSRSKYMERCWPVKNNPLLRIQTSRIARSLLQKSYSESADAYYYLLKVKAGAHGLTSRSNGAVHASLILLDIFLFCLSMLCPKYGILSNFSFSHNTLRKMSTFIYVYTINSESERKLPWLYILFYQ